MKTTFKALIYTVSALALSACSSSIDKLSNIGEPPPLDTVENPQTKPDYKPMSWPMPEPEAQQQSHANSLWQPGSRAFFRDNRASRVGDIVRVRVGIDDRAEIENETTRQRDTRENVGAPKVFGLEGKLGILTPGEPDRNSLFDITGGTSSEATGEIDRQERIETQVAAIVTQVLPNGNMVIDGKQEIRVNYEIREISVKGVIRPQDINSDNTIDSSQIAEARINYGGRGQITEIQTPRWGNQVIEAISPF